MINQRVFLCCLMILFHLLRLFCLLFFLHLKNWHWVWLIWIELLEWLKRRKSVSSFFFIHKIRTWDGDLVEGESSFLYIGFTQKRSSLYIRTDNYFFFFKKCLPRKKLFPDKANFILIQFFHFLLFIISFSLQKILWEIFIVWRSMVYQKTWFMMKSYGVICFLYLIYLVGKCLLFWEMLVVCVSLRANTKGLMHLFNKNVLSK